MLQRGLWRVVLCVLAVAALLGCEDKEEQTIEKCPSTIKKAKEAPPKKRQIKDGKLTCECGEQDGRGMVWGTNVYTDNSDLCTAALHAGVIEKKGGQITVLESDGCEYYRASVKSGVPSRSWKGGDASFYFEGHGNGTCGTDCPPRFADQPNMSPGSELSCDCDPAFMEGLVHGEGLYAAESSICNAAVHAGVLKADTGGKVTVKALEGCFGYLAVEKNGLKGQRWGQSELSFTFGDAVECQVPCPAAWRFVVGYDDETDITCWCDGTEQTPVWGTAVYEPKSSICQAAVHAGAIPPGTVGLVHARGYPGCMEDTGFVGSSANGVTTLTETKGSKDGFYFPDTIPLEEDEEVACPKPGDPNSYKAPKGTLEAKQAAAEKAAEKKKKKEGDE